MYRFGVFELDLRAVELRKQGRRVRLRRQSFEVLAAVLERAGEVVSREELRARLWPPGIQVDFDRGLNKAMVELREALGDDAESPRFIETLPRVGYRFIAPLSRDGRGVTLGQVAPHDDLRPQRSRRRTLAALLGTGAVATLVLMAARYTQPAPAAPVVVGSRQLTETPEDKLGLLTDGPRLYFSQNSGGEWQLMEMAPNGSGMVSFPTKVNNPLSFDVAPDASALLVGSISPGQQYEGEPQLWIQPLPGGEAQRVGNVQTWSASWSPDGLHIVFVSGKSLKVCRRDGSQVRTLFTGSGSLDSPRWSPDGKSIRFSQLFSQYIGEGGSTLYEIASDGSDAHPLLPGWNDPPQECCGDWTPDGGYYLFQSTRNGVTGIWALPERQHFWQAHQRQPAPVTTGPLNLMGPLPSRDGKRLFVVGNDPQAELVRYDPVTHQFVRYLGGIPAEGVNFSPDRKSIVYVSYPEGILWRSKVDGREKRQLTYPPLLAGVPQWSPDGKTIAFVGVAKGETTAQVYVTPADGGVARRLAPSNEIQFGPWWSPDSKKIAFSSSPRVKTSIVVVDWASGAASTLPASEGYCCPIWSHDGRSIWALASKPPRLMRFDVASRQWLEVWRGELNYYGLSRDDRSIYFDTRFEKEPAIYRLRLRDRKVERVASLVDVRRTQGKFGEWFDVAPDGSLMVLRNLSSNQVYSLDVVWP